MALSLLCEKRRLTLSYDACHSFDIHAAGREIMNEEYFIWHDAL